MLISSFDDAKATAQSLLSTSAVALSGTTFRSGADPGPWDQLAMAPLTCLLYGASPGATGLGMDWALEAAENVAKPDQERRLPNQFRARLGVGRGVERRPAL